MHRSCALVIVGLVLAVSGAWAAPASAGGPTSVLLSVPGQGRTASLYYTQPEYDALARLVGMTRLASTGSPDGSGEQHHEGPGITVTWLIHDITPWRVDRIYPTGKGAPWISTQVVGTTTTVWESPVIWHRARSGQRLMALLDRLGVADAAVNAGAFTGVPGAPTSGAPQRTGQDRTSEQAAVQASAPDSEEDSGQEPDAGWWALAGLLVGVLGTVLVGRLRRDAAPETATPPDGPEPALQVGATPDGVAPEEVALGGARVTEELAR